MLNRGRPAHDPEQRVLTSADTGNAREITVCETADRVRPGHAQSSRPDLRSEHRRTGPRPLARRRRLDDHRRRALRRAPRHGTEHRRPGRRPRGRAPDGPRRRCPRRDHRRDGHGVRRRARRRRRGLPRGTVGHRRRHRRGGDPARRALPAAVRGHPRRHRVRVRRPDHRPGRPAGRRDRPLRPVTRAHLRPGRRRRGPRVPHPRPRLPRRADHRSRPLPGLPHHPADAGRRRPVALVQRDPRPSSLAAAGQRRHHPRVPRVPLRRPGPGGSWLPRPGTDHPQDLPRRRLGDRARPERPRRAVLLRRRRPGAAAPVEQRPGGAPRGRRLVRVAVERHGYQPRTRRRLRPGRRAHHP